MAQHAEKEFASETIRLDGAATYRDCTFRDCTLVYGGDRVVLERPLFERCRLRLEGPAAATIDMLVLLKDACPDLVDPCIEKLIGSIAEPDDHD